MPRVIEKRKILGFREVQSQSVNRSLVAGHDPKKNNDDKTTN